ncbi:MAG: AAA family ATPase, partial [Candidatus Cybelea sp.]
MLRRLEIENYGLIARAGLEFSPGATIFTGETGSGKTMLLGALDFALGARAGADVVGRAARKAAVTIAFDPGDALRARLEADGFELDAGEEGSVAREMTDAGRSSIRVNGRPATAGYVRELAEAIAEIVGQHEAQHLLAPAYHLELLDRFAGEEAMRLREATANAHRRYEEAAGSLERLTHDDRDARVRYEEALFIVREIEDARVESAELERLAERRGYLDNVERIATALSAAGNALTQEEPGATNALGAAAAALATIGRFGDELQA